MNSEDQLRIVDCLVRLSGLVRRLAREPAMKAEAAGIAGELSDLNKRLQPGPVDDLIKLINEAISLRGKARRASSPHGKTAYLREPPTVRPS